MNAAFRSRYTVVVLTALIGTLATVGVFFLVCFWEYRVTAIDFESQAKSYLEFMDADLGDASTLMYNLAAFIGSSDHRVSANEFAAFSAYSLRRVKGLRDMGWAPRVTLAERPKFERDARAAGIAGFHIKQFGPKRKLIPATSRPFYYALLYVETGSSKRSLLLGFDLICEKLRAAAALRAVRTGRPAATPPTDVLTVKQPGAGVLSYMPAYSLLHGGQKRRNSELGVVLGVFDIPAIVGNIVTKHTTVEGLNLYLFNPAARPDRRAIFQTRPSAASGPLLSERALLAGLHWQSTVVLIDQHLGAIVTPAQPPTLVRWSVFGIATLAIGFIMTALGIAYLLSSLRRTSQLEALTTSLRATTEQITAISRHDALTGMPNRLLFQERMKQALALFERDAPFALLFLDLDRFKAVNDTLGHGAGDRLLCVVAERIAACVREVDTAARLGGDEFAIILAGSADRAIIPTVAHRLIASIGQPYLLDDQPIVIGVSIGAAIATPGVTLGSIVAAADLAMYAAKEAGRGTYRLFEPRLRAVVDEKRSLERDLRRALARGELEVHYQPLVHLAHNRVSAFEALVRWRHPEHGLIPPDRFIPVAEECGLIGQLGAWVLWTACEDAAAWPRAVKVAVNISPFQLTDTALLSDVLHCLESTGLSPARLEIELTEAAVLQQSETTLALLTGLRAAGVTVALDDFGTGYSSLSSLLRFPFDKIKIDRSFLEHVETSPSAASIVRAVVGLAAGLHLTTTGEGVETRQQLEHLRSCGCSEAQGYLFSPARPNAEVPGIVQALDTTAEPMIRTPQLSTVARPLGPTAARHIAIAAVGVSDPGSATAG